MQRMIIVLAALAVVVAGCGAAVEELTEEAVERGLEASGENGNVEFDLDEEGGEVRVETDDGSMSIGGGEVPDELTIELPDGGEVVSSFVMGSEVAVTLEYPGSDFDELVAFFDDRLGDWNRSSSSFESEGEEFRNVMWTSDDGGFAQVNTCFRSDGDGTTNCVSASQPTE